MDDDDEKSFLPFLPTLASGRYSGCVLERVLRRLMKKLACVLQVTPPERARRRELLILLVDFGSYI